jgi:hypothetical protein
MVATDKWLKDIISQQGNEIGGVQNYTPYIFEIMDFYSSNYTLQSDTGTTTSTTSLPVDNPSPFNRTLDTSNEKSKMFWKHTSSLLSILSTHVIQALRNLVSSNSIPSTSVEEGLYNVFVLLPLNSRRRREVSSTKKEKSYGSWFIFGARSEKYRQLCGWHSITNRQLDKRFKETIPKEKEETRRN